MGNRCADHVTPLYPQKLALIWPTGGGRSVGIVRSRTKATEFSLVLSLDCMNFEGETSCPEKSVKKKATILSCVKWQNNADIKIREARIMVIEAVILL